MGAKKWILIFLFKFNIRAECFFPHAVNPIFEISKLFMFTLEYLPFCPSTKRNFGHLSEFLGL